MTKFLHVLTGESPTIIKDR